MDHGEEEVYDEGDVAEQGEGEGDEGGFDEDELDSALADVQGALNLSPLPSSTSTCVTCLPGDAGGDESSRIKRLQSGGSQGSAGESNLRVSFIISRFVT